MTRSSNPSTARKPKPKLQTTDLMEQLKDDVESAGKSQEDVETAEEKPKPKRTRKPKAIEVPTEKKTREVGPATQKVIDRILALRKSGLGYPTICKTLNDEKVPTFKGGETWYPPVVRGICIRNGVERGAKAEAE